MEALKVASFSPITILPEKRFESRKLSQLPCVSPTTSSPSISKQGLSRSFHGSLVLLSAVLTTGVARALTYEEALQQSVTSSSPEFDASAFIDSIVGFASDNPLVIAGGATVLAVPLVLSQILKKPKAWGVESAKSAYKKLGSDDDAQLLDIRAQADVRQVGGPDMRGLGKRPVSVVYNREDKPGFLKRLSLKFKDPEETTLFVLDKFDGNSELVAELLTVNGFKAAYAIKDGAEGPRGWMNSELPWIEPKKALGFDLSGLIESISNAFGRNGEGSTDGLPLAIGLAAASGLGLLAFSEIETILQLLGSAALVQFLSKKLLFADDRKKTLGQLDEFVNTKVAPKELVAEIKEIGKALLPSPVSSKSLPAPTQGGTDPSATAPAFTAEQKTGTEAEAGGATEPTPQVNAVHNSEPRSLPRPLSPYASYPDLKPPTSPTPSQP